jgi:hypothetical protein
MLANMRRSKLVPSSATQIRGYRVRASGDAVCLTAYVAPDLARAVRLRAATEGRTISALVSEALERSESAKA